MTRIAKLTPLQRLFIVEYLKDFNATQAAFRAGYNPKHTNKTSNKLMNNPVVKAEIDKAIAKRAKKIELNADYVLKGIIECAERCMQKEPVMSAGRDPQQVKEEIIKEGIKQLASVWKFDSFGALKAYELLGKHLKLFTDKHELTGLDGKPIQIESSSARDKLISKLNSIVAERSETGNSEHSE